MSSPSKRAPRLRIVKVTPCYAPLVGGAERMLQAVSERLVQRGHEVTILTFDCRTMKDFSSGGAGLPPDEVLNGVHVLRVRPTSPRLRRIQQWVLRQRGAWRTAALLFGHDLWPLEVPSGLGVVLPLAHVGADVIVPVNWHFGAAFWACPPRRLRRVPRVAVPILHIERDWAKNPMHRRMFRACDRVIVLTEAERDFVEARGGRGVAVAGAGVDPRRFDRRDGASIRARYGIGDRPVVGFVGRQHTTKGVVALIDAMRTVWRHFPDAVLLLAGQTAHREPVVAQMLAAMPEGERDRVVLADDFRDDDGPSIMDACDVLALPSAEESFGLVMLEAWICGKPVIGADIASTRCIITSGVDGLTAKPFDAGDLAEKLLDLLADPSKRQAFGANGREKVLARYTWDRVTDVWEATFLAAAGRQVSSTRASAIDVSRDDQAGAPVGAARPEPGEPAAMS